MSKVWWRVCPVLVLEFETMLNLLSRHLTEGGDNGYMSVTVKTIS